MEIKDVERHPIKIVFWVFLSELVECLPVIKPRQLNVVPVIYINESLNNVSLCPDAERPDKNK